jgi:hypothetical protein
MIVSYMSENISKDIYRKIGCQGRIIGVGWGRAAVPSGLRRGFLSARSVDVVVGPLAATGRPVPDPVLRSFN